MEKTQFNTTIGDWTKWLAMLSLAVSAWWVEPTLHSDRPSTPLKPAEHHFIQDVDARLWQDPLEAAALMEHAAGDAQHKQNFAWIKNVLLDNAPNTLVLGAMVGGDMSPGQSESRRRTRYALLAALNKQHYVPNDPEHIGYIELAPLPGCLQPFPGIAFERFERESASDSAETKHLLVLWLVNDAFAAESYDRSTNKPYRANPRACLQSLFENLKVTPTIIGPADSGSLKSLLQAFADKQNASGESIDIKLYSPFATQALKDLSEQAKANLPQCAPDKPQHWCLTRTIATNRDLANALVDELQHMRRIDKDQTIALIGQWDTSYSRDLVDAFVAKWNCPDADDPKVCKDMGPQKNTVLIHYYSRGVDGRLPNEEPPKERKPDAASQSNAQNGAIERPEGNHQKDYLRRITDELEHADAKLFAECTPADRFKRKCGIRAIGIFGNDYYDKVLTLQALRKKFPNALFFTTDLEAAMLHPEDKPFTQNLLVASGYGLTLSNIDDPNHQLLQGEIPPFRDGYQTAVYYSTQLALCETPDYGNPSICGLLKSPQQFRDALQAKLFEIGRNDAVALIAAEHLPQHFELLETFKRYKLLLLSIAGMALLLYWLYPGMGSAFGNRYIQSAAIVLLSITGIGVWFFDGKPLLLEPFAWFEGVSIWPSELLRTISLLLSAHLIVKSFAHLRHCHNDLVETFLGNLRELPLPVTPRLIERIPLPCLRNAAIDLFKAWHIGYHNPHGDRQSVVYLNNYLNSVSLPSILRIAFPQAVLMFSIGFGLMATYGFPNIPGRGPWSFHIDFFVTLTSVFACLALLFCVVRITSHATRLAEALGKRTSWPDDVMLKHGLPPAAHNYFGDWLDVLVIAKITEPVGRFIFYPLWPLLLLYAARSPLFDNWCLTPTLAATMTTALAIAFYNAWQLRHMAENMRTRAVHRLNKSLLELSGTASPPPETEILIRQANILSERIQEMRDGAFAPLSAQPAVQAFIVAVSAISGLKLTEYFSFFAF